MIKLRWYQKKIPKLLFNYWRRNPKCHPIVAIPTGAGKSLIIADVIYEAVRKWDIEVLVLSHRKEILDQNRNALKSYLEQLGSDIDVGVYSAGLGEREKKQVTIAGIQSIYRKPHMFENTKLIIIDEVHLLPELDKKNTMYHRFLSALPDAKLFGLTATPYRLGQGYIVGPDHLFDDIIFDLTSKENFNRLVSDGFLTKLISKRTGTELDAEGTRIKAGDYDEKQLSLKFDKESITKAAVKEIIKNGENYKKWLIFAIDIEHAEHIVNELNEQGIPAMPVHSKLDMSRDPILEAFRNDKLRCLVNVNILTVGIDIPSIDLIAFLRPTKSPVLYVQAAGRGLRVAPNKEHCLVLDFARVVSTLGPINDVVVHKKKKGKGGEPITKVCPECDTICHPSVKYCEVCGHKFTFKLNLTEVSGNEDIVSTIGERWYNVDEIIYSKHEKQNAPRSIKVTYRCGIKTFNKWVCLEHKGWAKQQANHYIKYRAKTFMFADELNNVDSMLKITDVLMKEQRILVKEGGKYPEIIDYDFGMSEDDIKSTYGAIKK